MKVLTGIILNIFDICAKCLLAHMLTKDFPSFQTLRVRFSPTSRAGTKCVITTIYVTPLSPPSLLFSSTY